MMVQNLTQTLNMFAPHVVLPKIIASIAPPGPPAAEAAAQGAGAGGVRERRAQRANGFEAMQQQYATDTESTLASGTSMTGKTTFF